MSARRTLRRLVVGGVVYRWKVKHAHLSVPPADEGGAWGCSEVFTAFVEDHRSAPLLVRFPDGPGQNAGYPQAGVVWTSALTANLNLPSSARRLIELGRAAGWAPERNRRLFEVVDGFVWLPAIAGEGR